MALGRIVYVALFFGILAAFAFVMAPQFLEDGLPVSAPSVRVGVLEFDRDNENVWFTTEADLLADDRYHAETGWRRLSARRVVGDTPTLTHIRSMAASFPTTYSRATLVARTYVVGGVCKSRGRRRCAGLALRATELRAIDPLTCGPETYAQHKLSCPTRRRPSQVPAAPRQPQILTDDESNNLYPDDMRRAGLEGAATVAFVINAAGEVSRCRAIDSDNVRLGEEACRLIAESPNLVAAHKPVSGEKIARQRVRWQLED